MDLKTDTDLDRNKNMDMGVDMYEPRMRGWIQTWTWKLTPGMDTDMDMYRWIEHN
jgi:hypothetical protein